MATITKDVHVKVLTFDPAQGKMIPVPDVSLLCEDSGWLWDPNLSTGSPTTDTNGLATVTIAFEDTEEKSLNPFFTITIPSSKRTIPTAALADQQFTLPDSWTTRHYVKRRIPNITNHTDPNNPLHLFVGLHGNLRVAYTDFDASGIRNPIALPEDTARVHLSDYDDFLWIDWLNPDDTLEGVGVNLNSDKIIPVGKNDEYPYFDVWPTAPCALNGNPASPQAWLDPPGAPMGSLGGGSFQQSGPLAVDPHGFVFMIDGNVVRRFYPDGTFCETIGGPGSGITFNGPQGLALDQYRHLFVADSANNQITILRPKGLDGQSGLYSLVTSFGGPGSASSQFNNPRGMAIVPNRIVDGEELLAVADSGNKRVQVFRISIITTHSRSIRDMISPTLRLNHLAEFGPPGGSSGATASTRVAGALWEPVGVATDRQRRIFVCDRTWHRVSRWAPDVVSSPTAYSHEVDWETSGSLTGSGNREFDSPESIALDIKNGYVYVAESGNKRVQRLDAELGTHLFHWIHTYAPPLGNAFIPIGVAADARGEVYVSDSANHRVIRGTPFDGTGATIPDGMKPDLVGKPWTPKTDSEHLDSPAAVYYGPDGKLWVSDTGNNRILVFERDTSGKLTLTADQIHTGLDTPVGVAFDPEGNIFVVDSGNHRIRQYNGTLVHQLDIGGSGTGPAQFDHPRGLAIAQRIEPILFIADRDNNRIQTLKRDGTFVAEIKTADGQALDHPEDVAVDSRGNVYIADTGNGRILQFNTSDAFVRTITISDHGLNFTAPSGVSVDTDDKLLVTDRAQNHVYHIETDGTVLGYWDLRGLLRQSLASTSGPVDYYPELGRFLQFDQPTRAVVDARGLLAVADTGHDRIRLIRIHTDLNVNLFDLGEGLPDLSFRAITKANWSSELGLKINVGDVSIFDESHDFVADPIDDFSDDSYAQRQVLGPARSTNSALNVMSVVRRTQQWYQHHTRQDEPVERWGTQDQSKTLDVDLISSDGSYQFLDVNMAEDSKHGRRSDAWDDSVVAHEMTHWVFFKTLRPFLAPFSLPGLLQLIGGHSSFMLTSFNQTLTEGWAGYIEHFWGSEFGSIDRVRGLPMAIGQGLTSIAERDNTRAHQYLFGGPSSSALPTFTKPQHGLRNEGYFSNALYQLHRILTSPEVVFSDAPGYWHRYNSHISNIQSQRFTDTIWKSLRIFPEHLPEEETDKGSMVYLRNVLSQFHADQPDFSQIAQSIFELNNQLMPTITITEGTSDTAPGSAIGFSAIGSSLDIQAGQTKSLIIQVTDAAGQSLRGYQLKLHVTSGTPAHYSLRAGAGPQVRHGMTIPAAPPASELYRATNANGIVNLTVSPGAGAANTQETVSISYQPDFDTDESFDPPDKTDDQETTLRKLYLYELRTAAKIWAGTGNNFGAIVDQSLTVKITAP